MQWTIKLAGLSSGARDRKGFSHVIGDHLIPKALHRSNNSSCEVAVSRRQSVLVARKPTCSLQLWYSGRLSRKPNGGSLRNGAYA